MYKRKYKTYLRVLLCVATLLDQPSQASVDDLRDVFKGAKTRCIRTLQDMEWLPRPAFSTPRRRMEDFMSGLGKEAKQFGKDLKTTVKEVFKK